MNSIISKIGLDKIAHYSLGGLIAALATFVFGLQDNAEKWQWIYWSIVGWIVVFVLELVKEFIIDEKPNKIDFIYTMAGPATVNIIIVLGILLGMATA